MNKPNSKSEKPKDERQYSQKQFELLNNCNAAKDMSVWNQWRKENPQESILFEGAAFWQAYLKRANLEGANLQRADLRGANLEGANLKNALLWEARLQEANLRESSLEGAKLMRSHLQGAEFGGGKLQGADFSRAIVDGETLIWRCKFDRKTKFEGVALGQMRIYPKEKELFEYNIRRMNWEEWYKKGCWWQRVLKRIFVWLFWQISDYGISTKRIIYTFLGLAVLFALLYRLFPGFVMVYGKVGDIRGFWHALYFSVVTMTTLGFGDIAANPDSWVGQTLLMIQVILGYVLLGALVTRFAVLFTAGGPAGKFADEKEKEDEEN
jgi:hypothetical protein